MSADDCQLGLRDELMGQVNLVLSGLEPAFRNAMRPARHDGGRASSPAQLGYGYRLVAGATLGVKDGSRSAS
jgi:hypothetical protein